jgi:methyl-accepting chemotaxis protein
VSDLVGEIAMASNEQAQGFAQVNQGLNQIDGVTQQNTANAEESAAAAEELSGQAMQLQQLLHRFSLKGRSSSTSRRLPAERSQLALPEA